MKSTIHRLPSPLCVRAWLVALLTVAGCGDSRSPVLPSPGGSPGGLAAALGSDGGTAIDSLSATDMRDVAGADTLSDAYPVLCDLVTYILTQKGCPLSQACYPVDGVGRCLDTGFLPNSGLCVPDQVIQADTQSRCLPGLACVTIDSVSGCEVSGCKTSRCEILCDVFYPGNNCSTACTALLPDNTAVGYCSP